MCVCVCASEGTCMCFCLRDDRFLCGTQAHTNTLACTVQIHTWLGLYTHRGCVMQLLHANYTVKRRVYVHGRVLSSNGALLRHRSRGSFTVAGKSARRKDRSVSEQGGGCSSSSSSSVMSDSASRTGRPKHQRWTRHPPQKNKPGRQQVFIVIQKGKNIQ